MILFKYGGHAISENEKADPAIEFLAERIKAGEKIVIVHGGGPQINRELEVHGIVSEMVAGLRKTTPEVFEVVQRTLSGEVLRNLTNQLIGHGVNAIGISAGDGGLIRAKIADAELGLVGEIEKIDSTVIRNFLAQGLTPIVSPIAVSDSGIGLNLNADLVAGAIGGALGSDVVMFSTDVEGIYRNWPDAKSLIGTIGVAELIDIAKDFQGGMIPKARAAISAIQSGAKSVRVFDGRTISNLADAFAGKTGTLVVA